MIQYITNNKGRKTAVVLPIKEWEAIQAELQKRSVLDSLRQGYLEMQEMEASGTTGKSWDEIMQELNEAE